MNDDFDYIKSKLDFTGGGQIDSRNGLHQVKYCCRSSKLKIIKVNIVLFFKWFKRRIIGR